MTSLFDLNQPVVLDLGSGLTKAGFAGSAEPTALLGTLVGHAKHPQVIPLSTASTPPAASIANATSTSPLSPNTRPKFTAEPLTPRRIVVGNALQTLSGVVRLSHPLHRGTVQSWPDAEEVWRHVLYDVLALGHGEHPMLVTENALVPRANRDRLAEFFFESAQVPSLCVAVPAVLALYASGRTTGLVLDVGDTLATALPVAEGHCDMHAIRRLDIGGRDVTDRLVTLLRKSGYALFASSSERQAARRIKERLGYIAVNPRDEEHRFAADAPELSRFDLPDGNVVSVGAESFRAPEILFRPEIMSREFGGVHDCVKAAIDSVDLELKQRLYGSVLLATTTWAICSAADFTTRLTQSCIAGTIDLVLPGGHDQVQRLWAEAAGRDAWSRTKTLQNSHTRSTRSIMQCFRRGVNTGFIVNNLQVNGGDKS